MKVNILVVDDRPEGLMAVEAVLKSPSYNLVLAKSGVEALKFLLKDDFAVILMDVQMPEMNGFETAEIIKTRDKSKDIPIVFMSAISQDEQYVYQGYKVGAVDYILKPFDPYVLKSKVAIFVDLYQKNIQLMDQAKKLHENEIKTYTQALDRLELESLRKYRNLADSIPQIVFRLLPDGSHEYFNKVWFEYTGYSLEESQGHSWRNAIHSDDLAAIDASLRDQPRSEMEVECRIKSGDGEYRWHLVQFGPENYNELEEVIAWFGTATDIEERKRNEGFQRLLINAGEILVSSLNYKETFAKVAELAIQEISDCCKIEVLNEKGKLETVTLKQHAEESFPDFGSLSIIESGKSLFRPVLDHEELGECSLIVVPLTVHGRTLGVLSLLYKTSRHKYDEGHLKTVEELGRRSAMALENSILYDLSQKAIEVRNDFLSIASHELNTPMTSLKLQLQMVQRILESKDINAMNRFPVSIGNSLRQVDRMIGLINVLLDVSKIQSGKFHFAFASTTVSEIIQEVLERNKEVFSISGSKLYVSNIPDMMVTWDKMRIEQVVVNLLMNAVKYAPGRIELNVSYEDDKVNIEVRDYGKGIKEEKIRDIFDRFTRATCDSIAGMGLGLYIVKQIVDGHEGVINVNSSEEGSSFLISLPKGDHLRKGNPLIELREAESVSS
jgi:PAS domain S-box-containing protein